MTNKVNVTATDLLAAFGRCQELPLHAIRAVVDSVRDSVNNGVGIRHAVEVALIAAHLTIDNDGNFPEVSTSDEDLVQFMLDTEPTESSFEDMYNRFIAGAEQQEAEKAGLPPDSSAPGSSTIQ